MIKPLTDLPGTNDDAVLYAQALKTGYTALDFGLGGIAGTDLVLVAARNGNCGKLLMRNLAAALGRQYPVLFINTEKQAARVAEEFREILLPKGDTAVQDESLLHDLNAVAKNIFIEDEVRFVEEVEQCAAEFRRENGPDAIILIDDLHGLFLSGEISTRPKEREEEAIAGNLKRLALKHRIPMIVFSKILSPGTMGTSTPPVLHDLDHLTRHSCMFDKIIGVQRHFHSITRTDAKCDSQANTLVLHLLKTGKCKQDTVILNFSESNRHLLQEYTHDLHS